MYRTSVIRELGTWTCKIDEPCRVSEESRWYRFSLKSQKPSGRLWTRRRKQEIGTSVDGFGL